MRHVALVFGLACLLGRGVLLPAGAHDIYRELQTPQGTPCCGGDPVTGDCEPLEESQFTLHPDGSATVRSARYGAAIQVAAARITWLPLPPGRDGRTYPGHWCGAPRQQASRVYPAPVVPWNPDPVYWTYCAFIAPGGM
jgi:hypothetical protein